MIPSVYYPIFEDGHHFACKSNLWTGWETLSGEDKCHCEQVAIKKILEQGTYFSQRKQRGGTVFDLKGRNWWEVPPEEREALGKFRAESHNLLFQHKETITENREILREYVRFLHTNSILPILVIAPFTAEYNRYLLKEMKRSVLELVADIPEEIRFVDFNQFTCFDATDFVDTDHLSQKGAEKFSGILVELFGK